MSHTVLIDFRVEPEEVVYPMVPSGKRLDEMIRRPRLSPATDPHDSVAPPAMTKTDKD